jgi:hypothetical protein
VLIFTDAKKVAAEAYRVLKPHGVFGDNEMTPRQPLPAHLLALVMSGVALSLLTEEERRAVFQKAGFAEVTSHVFPIDVLEVSLLTPLRTDGLRRYVWALVQQLFDPRLKALMPPLAFKQIFQMFSYLGYGLYVARKM